MRKVGPSRSMKSQSWPATNAGAIARLVPTMLPTITFNPSRRDFWIMRSASGQPAALVELDVHDIEQAEQTFDVGEPLTAFIGGDRNRAIDKVEIRFAAARQWLLEQEYTRLHEHGHEAFE